MSQFTLYSSSDRGNGSDAPGVMYGQGGELVRILDKCLVNGYTGKAAAGWTKPIANTGTGIMGCYKQGSGSGLSVVINDNGPNGLSVFKEAWATGWETVTSLAAPVGAGTGQFPTAAQSLTTGHVVIRKSTTQDATNGRQWLVFADSATVYVFVLTGDTTSMYFPFWFGDFYSLRGSSDAYRCMIRGGFTENTGSGTSWTCDQVGTFGVGALGASFAARNYTGLGASITLGALGFYALAHNNQAAGATAQPMKGFLTSPNGPDNSYHMVPLLVYEPTSNTVRGRFRGICHVCHPATNFSDGQVINGSNDLAGRSYQLLIRGGNLGLYAVETTDTLDTN